MNPSVAIIDGNSLECMAMRSILEDMFPGVEVLSYSTYEEFVADSRRFFVHFFVSKDILFSHPDDFDMLKKQTIVLGSSPAITASGYHSVNLEQDEKSLVKSLMLLHDSGHHDLSDRSRSGEHAGPVHPAFANEVDLSEREKDVLKLIVKGNLNKEMADILNLSIPTVVFHRNNICRKLGTRSIGRLTVYAVFSGLVDISEI